MARQLGPSQENPFIEIGRLISQESYKRDRKEIRLENMVIDLIRGREGGVIVGEVKKSSRYERSARMQLAFYLYRLKTLGIDARGELLFPRERKKIGVTLNQTLVEELEEAIRDIEEITRSDVPPPVRRIRFCSKCGYNEFCFA